MAIRASDKQVHSDFRTVLLFSENSLKPRVPKRNDFKGFEKVLVSKHGIAYDFFQKSKCLKKSFTDKVLL